MKVLLSVQIEIVETGFIVTEFFVEEPPVESGPDGGPNRPYLRRHAVGSMEDAMKIVDGCVWQGHVCARVEDRGA